MEQVAVIDYRGLPLTETAYQSGQTNPSTTTYAYDDRANLTTVTDPELHTTTYEYDGINRNTKITYPDASYTTLTYDKSSNLTIKADANGTTTTNSYDTRYRLTSRTLSTGSGVTGVTSESYTYDQLNRLTSGTNSQSGNQISALVLIYDPLSRLTTEAQTASWQTKTAWYAYDNNSNLTTLTHPDGQVQSYTYDALNRNTTVGYSGQTIATYAFSGLTLANLAYNNSRTTSYTYDSLQRLSGINGGTGITPYNYTYDDSYLITADGTKAYNYDGLKRLLSAAPANTGSVNQNTESYTYDKTGNRKTDTTNTIGTSYATNLLDQYTNQTWGINKSYTYDNNGNLKSDGSKTYTYDYNNRLIQVTQSGITLAQYQYDVLGRRIQSISHPELVSGTSTIYVYAWDNIIQELKTTGWLTLKKEYINGIWTDNILAYDAQESTNQDKISFCQIRVLPYQSEFSTYGYASVVSDCTATMSSSTGVTTKRYYYHVNHLGSVIWLSDNSGNVVQAYTYDSFGKAYIVNWSGTLAAIDGNTNLYGNSRFYTGREYDKELNLYYLRARYYNPETGRFISRDPIGQKDQVNLYTYVANPPVIYTDPTGLFLDTVWDIANVAYDVGRWVKNVAELAWDGAQYAYGSVTSNSCLTKQAVASAQGNLSDLWEVAVDAWTDALATMIPFVPAGTTKVVRMGKNIEQVSLRGAANPVIKEAAKKWRQMHKEYNYWEWFTKEVSISWYWRADAVNFEQAIVKELKPNNPSAVAKWEKQLQRYIEWLKNMETSQWLKPSNWEWFVVTY